IRKVNRIDKGNGLPSLDAIGKALGVSKTESDQLAATLFENDILVFNTDSAGYRAATLHPTLKLVCAAVESKADLRISAVKVAYADLLRSAN
ncbi:MAG: hypothetical protein KDD62_15175, partial [Bdellovibrionales bacterium]|nr:hypothetical protein [Bdellovibrionales bacterium]